MKNKATTYLLAAVVLVIWGVIVYRVFSAVGGDDDALPLTAAPRLNKEPLDDYAERPDTARLGLHYRDPFGAPARDTLVPAALKSLSPPPKTAPPPPLNWSFVKYAGFIRNPASGKLLAILVINGRNTLLAEGETAEQVKLLKNRKDSVKISFRNQTRFITMTTTPL